MAFNWTPLNSNDIIRHEHINEMKNNLDILFSWEGISWTWQHLPVSRGQKITVQTFKELRLAADSADEHKCKSHNSGYDSSIHDVHDSGH